MSGIQVYEGDGIDHRPPHWKNEWRGRVSLWALGRLELIEELQAAKMVDRGFDPMPLVQLLTEIWQTGSLGDLQTLSRALHHELRLNPDEDPVFASLGIFTGGRKLVADTWRPAVLELCEEYSLRLAAEFMALEAKVSAKPGALDPEAEDPLGLAMRFD